MSLLQHQNCLATSNHAMLGFHFPLAVLGSIGDKFGFTNLRSYCSKSEFYDVFMQDKRTRLDFIRIFICLCLSSVSCEIWVHEKKRFIAFSTVQCEITVILICLHKNILWKCTIRAYPENASSKTSASRTLKFHTFDDLYKPKKS